MDASVTRQVSKRIGSYPDYMMITVRILLIILAASICGSAFAQSGYVYTQYLTTYYASRSIFLCSDNSVVVLGNSDDFEEYHLMYIAITKLDPQGNLLWRRYISSGSSWYISITGVDIDSEDKVTFLITRFGASIINLGTIDSAGVIHFFPNSVQNTLGLTFNKALRTSNGEIVAVGMVSQTYDISSACYFRFSATGDTLATAFWPVDQGSQYYKAEAYDLALMDNGNLLVTCSLNSTSRTLLEINLNGFVVSRYDIPGEMQLYVVPICREPNSQSYLIAYRMGESPNNSIFIDRFENGVFEPLFTIPTSYLSFVSSMILGTDAIYLCGTFGINASLVSLSYAGVVNWSRNQQGSNVCDYINAGFGSYSTALLGIDDAGCVYWAWGNVGEQVIIKLLPNGQVPVLDEFQTPSVNRISAYPNPMKNQINIKITHDDSIIRNDSIDIFNIKGQLVRSLKLIDSETKWDGKDDAGHTCPSGVYLIRSGKGKNPVSKICKIN